MTVLTFLGGVLYKTITIATFIATAGFASAATSLIDFSDVAGTTSGNWNNMTSAGGNSISNLIDNTGAAGTIDLSLTFGFDAG